MKILGFIPQGYAENKYILETTKSELINLMGYRYTAKELDERLKIGADIPIAAMYDRLYEMANAEKDLMQISAKLKAAMDFVDTALPTIKSIVKKEGD